jgi:hypothetical protein
MTALQTVPSVRTLLWQIPTRFENRNLGAFVRTIRQYGLEIKYIFLSLSRTGHIQRREKNSDSPLMAELFT